MYTPKPKSDPHKRKSPNTLKINRCEPRADTLLINLLALNFPNAVVTEIKQRKKLGQPRTQISREMNIPKLHVNQILEVSL